MAKIEREKLEDAAWSRTHRDYRSVIEGQRHILVLDRETGATTLAPLSGLSDEELIERAQDAVSIPLKI